MRSMRTICEAFPLFLSSQQHSKLISSNPCVHSRTESLIKGSFRWVVSSEDIICPSFGSILWSIGRNIIIGVVLHLLDNNLTTLKTEKNFIKESLNKMFSSYKRLNEIDLSKNNISLISHDTFTRLKSVISF